MNEETFECSCEKCDGHIKAPLENAGRTVECPHCHESTRLAAPNKTAPSGLTVAIPPPVQSAPDELGGDRMHSAQKRVPPQSKPVNKAGLVGESAGMRMLLPVGRSGWAIAAGYLGLLSLFLLPAPVAVIVSIVAILDIKKSKNSGKPKHGMGRAVFGLIAGIAGTILLATMIVGWMRFASEAIR